MHASLIDLPAQITDAWEAHKHAALAGQTRTAEAHMRRLNALLELVPRPKP